MSFRRGQQVVCVRGNGRWDHGSGLISDGPALNDIVTIRGFDNHPHRGLLFEEWIRPDQVYNEFSQGSGERGYAQHWFRPLTTQQTDISVFQKLTHPKQRQLVDA